jgi:hypothetical protein
MGEETEGRNRREMHRRRDGGKETEGTDLWGEHAREERDKKEEERKGNRRGRGTEEEG